MTQAVWDSWLEIHPETAERLGIAEGRPADDYLSAWDYRGERLFSTLGCDVMWWPCQSAWAIAVMVATPRDAAPTRSIYFRLTPKPPQGAFPGCRPQSDSPEPANGQPLATTDGSRQQLGRGIAQAVTAGTARRTAPCGPLGAPRPRYVPRGGVRRVPLGHEYRPVGLPRLWSLCYGLLCGKIIFRWWARTWWRRVGKMSWLRIERYFEEPQEGANAP